MEIFVIMLTALVLYILEGVLYKRLWSVGLKADVNIAPRSAFCGDKCRLEITLTNRKLLPLPWLWVKLHISSTLHFEGKPDSNDSYIFHNALFCIMGWQEIKRTLPFTCTKRGYYPIRSFELVGTGLLFNAKYTLSFGSPCAITVYPQLLGQELLERLMARYDGITAAEGYINPDPFEFAGIREYMPSDSFRDINFKAAAHSGTLMTNRHNPTVRGEIDIILCIKPLNERFEEECFEYSISLAATLAEYYLSKGYRVAFSSNGVDCATGESVPIPSGIGEGQLYNIYERLARLSYEKFTSPEMLKMEYGVNRSAVFISPTADNTVTELYSGIEEGYLSACWLYPIMSFDMPRIKPPASSAELVPVPPEVRS